MAIEFRAITEVFSEHKFARTRDTVKLCEYRAPTTGQFVYLYKERDHSASIQLVIHPALQFRPFLDLPGVTCPAPEVFRHGSNMRQFPKRVHRGETETHYGRAMEIASLDALARFLQFLDTPAGSVYEGADLPPRLTAIELRNFKGFGERILADGAAEGTRLELAPITLLFGANSSGKSTILQALQYVREVLERRNANPDRTVYGGEFIDLGGFRNLVHQRDLTRRIGIKLELELNRARIPDLVPEPWEDWQPGQTQDEEGIWEFHELLQTTKDRTEAVSIGLEIGWSDARRTAVVVGYEAGVNGVWLARITASDDGRDVSIRINKDNPIFVRYATQEDIDTIAAAFDDWIDPSDLQAPNSAGAIQVKGASTNMADAADDNHAYSVFGQILARVRDAGMERPGSGLRQWLIGFDSALPRLGDLLAIPASGSGGSANIYIARDFTAFLSSLVVGPGVLLRDQLRKLRYLGPIRNVPIREFDAALTPDEARWADGTAAWETLLTGDADLVSEVSLWMSSPDKLDTGYEIERRQTKEVHAGALDWLLAAADSDAPLRLDPKLSTELRALPERRRLDLIEATTGMRVQPRDVGIGISQVLPVVVATLEPSASLVAIEQPELHIHPAVQVGLGDLLIEGAKQRGISFLIETHSEHLILRLLRRIRETTAAELPPGLSRVAASDINVLYVERSDSEQVEIRPIGIDENGKFLGRWPKGFFPERMREALPKEIRERAEAKRGESE